MKEAKPGNLHYIFLQAHVNEQKTRNGKLEAGTQANDCEWEAHSTSSCPQRYNLGLIVN
jgi:hypothetical protein